MESGDLLGGAFQPVATYYDNMLIVKIIAHCAKMTTPSRSRMLYLIALIPNRFGMIVNYLLKSDLQ